MSPPGRLSWVLLFTGNSVTCHTPFLCSCRCSIVPSTEYRTDRTGVHLGGQGDDFAYGIAVDTAGKVYVTGTTTSLDFPTTANSVQPQKGPPAAPYSDAFVAKLDPEGTGPVYITYLGGGGFDEGRAIAVDIRRCFFPPRLAGRIMRRPTPLPSIPPATSMWPASPIRPTFRWSMRCSQ
ncbi:MAG: hypothetical protein E6J80_10400 [Deltaproteobacteria bacterium]|nr:MAG: hypothetical protein E6J80_10400 [Deltaproteobacteria bacterium]